MSGLGMVAAACATGRDSTKEPQSMTNQIERAREELQSMLDQRRKWLASCDRTLELLAPEWALFEARTGHDVYVTRLYAEHTSEARRHRKEIAALEVALTTLTNEAAPAGEGRDAKAIAAAIVQSCCETDPADPEHPDTVMIGVGDLESIARMHVELADERATLAPQTTPDVGVLVDGILRHVAQAYGHRADVLFDTANDENVAALTEAVRAALAALNPVTNEGEG